MIATTPLKIAIASGKGGTGKTTVATNLAWLASQNGLATAYLDCDTEAPNGHLFLRPIIENRQEVTRMVPQVDESTCIHCGQCGEICQFSAIACLEHKILTFSELCHSCGGCMAVCPADAITETPRTLGILEIGCAGTLQFVQGCLNIGEAASPPMIQAVKRVSSQSDLLFYDAPPGTTCPMIEAVRGCDYVVLVTEPTPFGLHDLRLALETVKLLKIECGVVINRAVPDLTAARQICLQARIPILAEIPDRISIAEAYSKGQLVVEAVPSMRRVFAQLLLKLAFEINTKGFPEAARLNLERIVHSENESVEKRSLSAEDNPSPHFCSSLKTQETNPNHL